MTMRVIGPATAAPTGRDAGPTPGFASAADTQAAMRPGATMDGARRRRLLWYLVASDALRVPEADAVAAFAAAAPVPTALPAIPDPGSSSITLYGVLRFLTIASSDNGRDTPPDPLDLVDGALQRAARRIATNGRHGVDDDASTWALTQLR